MIDRDFISGVFLLCLGSGALILTSYLPAGTTPADDVQEFPRIIGTLIILIGAFISATAAWRCLRTKKTTEMDPWVLRPLGCMILATLAFGILMRPLGFALTATVCALVGSFAAPFPSFLRRLAVSVVVAALAVIVFLGLLGLNFRAWPSWI
jgi:hypothetical protein